MLARILPLVLLVGCVAAPTSELSQSLGAIDGLALERAVGDDPTARTLEAPPRYATGEWWRVEATDVFTGTTRAYTVVVAGTEGENYVLGLPVEEIAGLDDIMSLHVPPLGDVGRADLSFWAHERFEPLRFPVREGDAWQTVWEVGPVNVTIEVLNATSAEVRTDGPYAVTATYEATAGWFTSFRAENFGEWTLLEHGYGHEGDLLVPRGQLLAWITGRFAGVLDFDAAPAAPVNEIDLEERFDRVSVGVFLGGAPGHYRETNVAPDGERFEYDATITAAELEFQIYGKPQPEGTWSFEHVATGRGIVASEAVAYELYTATLPNGPLGRHDGEI